MSLVRSYSPLGAITVRLAPTIVFGGALTNSRMRIAGLPARLTESRMRVSARPERVIEAASSATCPLMSPHE